MLLFTPVRLLLIAAVVPGLILMVQVYNMDTVEKEPPGLLAKCFLYGVLSIIPAIILESIGMNILGIIFSEYSVYYEIVSNFIVIACSEELSKYFLMKRATWNHPAFNYRFDAVIYTVFTGLGFAIFENINYVFSYGLATAAIRAITAVPAHTIFAVFMGHYYGQAKLYDLEGDPEHSRTERIKACLVPILMHGFYDFAASSDSGIMTAVFWIFLICLYVIAYRRIKTDSAADIPL